MNKLNKRIALYILLAGYIPTIAMYYIAFRLSFMFESVSLIRLFAFLTISSPVIAPLIVALPYLRKNEIKNEKGIWLTMITQGVLLIVIVEILLYYLEPQFQGGGVISAGVSTLTLIVILFIKNIRKKK